MLETVPMALTIGEISRRLQCSVHRVEYLIRARGIVPCQLAGHVRLFTEGDLSLLGSELEAIEARRNRGRRERVN